MREDMSPEGNRDDLDFRSTIGEPITRERQETEALARRLGVEAANQWRKSVEGIFALPAAMTLTFATSSLYIVSFLTRGFEVFQQTASDLQRNRERMERQQRGGDRHARSEREPKERPGEPARA